MAYGDGTTSGGAYTTYDADNVTWTDVRANDPMVTTVFNSTGVVSWELKTDPILSYEDLCKCFVCGVEFDELTIICGICKDAVMRFRLQMLKEMFEELER